MVLAAPTVAAKLSVTTNGRPRDVERLALGLARRGASASSFERDRNTTSVVEAATTNIGGCDTIGAPMNALKNATKTSANTTAVRCV
jgi:hypothetical protein